MCARMQRKITTGSGDLMATLELEILVILIVAALVYADSRTLWGKISNKGRLQGMASTSPVAWAFGTVLMFILVVPIYLFTRPKLVEAGLADAIPEMKRCSACDRSYALDYDGCPYCSGAKPIESYAPPAAPAWESDAPVYTLKDRLFGIVALLVGIVVIVGLLGWLQSALS